MATGLESRHAHALIGRSIFIRYLEDRGLELLQGFLLADTDTMQRPLSLWAYDFEILPIELISSIYEEFYHKENVYRVEKKNTTDRSTSKDTMSKKGHK